MKDELSFLIENIPVVLKLYVPGVVFLSVYLFLNGGKVSTTTKTYAAVIVSYVLCSLVKLISEAPALDWTTNSEWTTAASATILGVITSLLVTYILHNEKIAGLLGKYLHKPVLDVWNIMLDLDNGTMVAIYEKGKDYFVAGSFMLLDDSMEDPWIVLNGYKKFSIPDGSTIGEYEPYQCKYMVKLSNVEHFEFFYKDDNDELPQDTG